MTETSQAINNEILLQEFRNFRQEFYELRGSREARMEAAERDITQLRVEMAEFRAEGRATTAALSDLHTTLVDLNVSVVDLVGVKHRGAMVIKLVIAGWAALLILAGAYAPTWFSRHTGF